MTAPPVTRVTVLRGSSKIGIVLGTLLMAALAAFAVYGITSGQTHGVGETVICSLIAVMFGGFALACLVKLPGAFGRHELVFDHDGVTYEVTRGATPWRVQWVELTRAEVSTYTNRSRSNGSTLVRLDLYPTDPDAFAARHPDMARMRKGEFWRHGLGPNTYDIAPVAVALRTYAGPRAGGVVEEPWTGRVKMR